MANYLVRLCRTTLVQWSDPTNGDKYVQIKKFKSWGDIVITLMEPLATDQSLGRLDILKIQREGLLVAWARIKARRDAISRIIIVKKYLEPEPGSKVAVFNWV